MPHSVPPDSPLVEDEVLPDAPPPVTESHSLTPTSRPEPSIDEEDVDVNDHPPMKADSDATRILPSSDIKLEDLFADDSSSDEFSSSAPTIKTEPQPNDVKTTIKSGGTPASSPETMRAFYQRLFPFHYHFLWLNHSTSPTPSYIHREFAFTLPNSAYLRYQSFPTSAHLRSEILRLIPSRFEIGPVYTTNPRDRKSLRKSQAFKPLSKELVFDIDLTDYDDIRTCCEKTNICEKCWEYITMAIKVVHAALVEDLGFSHVLWVYSGRRGAHAWICDKRARVLTDQQRRGIAGYLEIIKGSGQSGKRVNLKRPLHPHIARSLTLLAPHFSNLLHTQCPFSSPSQEARLLSLLLATSNNLQPLCTALTKKWASHPTRPSHQRWADIDALAKTLPSIDTKALLEAKQDIVLEYSYPRLDVEVSKKMGHLLKSPFVVHPGTGRVCVPIPVREESHGLWNAEGFDPLAVVTVSGLLEEVDAWDGELTAAGPESGRKVQDWEKTGLKASVEYFREFVDRLLADETDDINANGTRIKVEGKSTGVSQGRLGPDAMEF